MLYPLKIFFIICLVIGIVVAVLSWNKEVTEQKSNSNAAFAKTTLFLSPNPLMLSYQTGKVDIIMDTHENEIKFVQLYFSFDPKKIYDIEITRDNTLKTKAEILENNINQINGTAIFMLNIPAHERGLKGKVTIGHISFKTFLLNNQKTLLSFDPKTLVTDPIHTTSVLKSFENATIIREDKK